MWKAGLIIYNGKSIDLSYYSVSRYTNGATQASNSQQLEGIIEPYSTFVIGLEVIPKEQDLMLLCGMDITPHR